MKIQEVRDLLEKHGSEEHKIIIVELYKALPKRIREERAIDELIRNPGLASERPGSGRHEVEPPDIEFLAMDIEEFVEYAYKQYFLAPNSFVAKRDRPKWRFEVKRFVKAIHEAAADPGQASKAAELLEKLYNVLSYACHYTLFSGPEPFASVGIEQPQFYCQVLALKRQAQLPQEFVSDALVLLVGTSTDGSTLRSDLIKEFLSFLGTADLKEMAIAACQRLSGPIWGECAKRLRAAGVPGNLEPYLRDAKACANDLAEVALRVYLSLSEHEKAIACFQSHYRAEPEVKLYVLLELLMEHDLPGQWLRVYEEAVRAGIRPRDKLRLRYEELKDKRDLRQHS